MQTRTTLPLLILLGVASCGPGNGGKNAASDLARAICDVTFTCCTRGEVSYALGPYVTADDCADRLVRAAERSSDSLGHNLMFGEGLALPSLAALEVAVAAGRTHVNQEALDACLKDIRNQTCNAPLEDEPVEGCIKPEPPPESPCQSELIFEGQGEAGSACYSPGYRFECRAGLGCQGGSGLGSMGMCVPLGGLGEPCFADAECQDELYCSQVDGTCQEFRTEGEACAYVDRDGGSPWSGTPLVRCAAGLVCDPVTETCAAPCDRGYPCASDASCDEEQGLFCVSGRCDGKRTSGEPCESSADCTEGLRCAPEEVFGGEWICVDLLGLDEDCTGDGDCASGFCDPATLRCAAAKPPGGLCPTGRDAQCVGGYCETGFVSCTTDDDCLGSHSCDTDTYRCNYYCVANRPDGSPCDSSAQCESGTCVQELCVTLPLPDGQPCSADYQCESEFCGLDTPQVCEQLPLGEGKPCSSGDQCESGVCFGDYGAQICVTGLSEGARCGTAAEQPCARDLYCDSTREPPTCVPLRETGEACTDDYQCRGACVVRFSHMMCDATPRLDAVMCDGQ